MGWLLVVHWQPFGLRFWYRHKVYGHNNRCQSPTFLDIIWNTKYWPDCNFAWYLAVTEVKIERASGHFQNGGDIMPTLAVWKQLAMQGM